MKCFYHNDIDGKSAGAIVARKTGNYNKEDYIMYDYSKPIPVEVIKPGETVYFVDLSFSPASLDALKTIVYDLECDLIWCDHHNSSMELLKQYPEFADIKGYRRIGISGAALTYMYLYGSTYQWIPQFLKHISDFDCWLFKYEHTLEFKYAIEMHDHDALDLLWNQLMRDEQNQSHPLLNTMIKDGTVIKEYVERELESYRDRYAYESEIEGHKCLVVNRSSNSLIFGDRIKDYPVVALWAFDGERYRYSIYSENGVDCSKIAEKYGGGGHKGASGFSTSKLILPKK